MYSFKDSSGKISQISLVDSLENKAYTARKQYETSKRYIFSQAHYLWRYAEKRYRLDTQDRAVNKQLKSWQSNITGGLGRTFIDVFVSSLPESPIIPLATAVGETPQEVALNVSDSLAYCADKTGLQDTSKVILKQGLKTGQYAMRIGYRKQDIKDTYITYDAKGNPEEHEYVKKRVSLPFIEHVPVWNIFPDPYSQTKRYVCERLVTTYESFIDKFGYLIYHKENQSPLSSKKILESLPINSNGADFSDYGSIVSEILQKKNSTAEANDSYVTNQKTRNTNSVYTQDQDSDVTDGLIEVILYTTRESVIVHANGYPVYIGKNVFGFINYVVRSATDETQTIGTEGVPFLLEGIEEVYDSFVNHLIDSAKVTTTPTFTGIKGVFEDESAVESMKPGEVLWIETPPINGEVPIRRIDKGSATDNGLLDVMQTLATQKAGISEYNMGIAARERTATGANAVVESDKKRLTPYINSFVSCMSEAMSMCLDLIIKNWTTPQIVAVTNAEGAELKKQIVNKDLAGEVNVSLDMNGILATKNDINVKRLIEFFPQIINSGITDNPGEVLAEIFRGLGLNPSKYKIAYNKKPESQLPEVQVTDSISQELQQANNPQLNLGNEGEGNIL